MILIGSSHSGRHPAAQGTFRQRNRRLTSSTQSCEPIGVGVTLLWRMISRKSSEV